jgi:D-amino-acid dehydrogenase
MHAFGHGHVGLTAGAATARLVADLISGRRPTIDVTPYAAQRF